MRKALGVSVLLLAGAAATAAEPAAHLAPIQGSWTGTNDLWFLKPDKPRRSDATVTVEGEVITYTWSYKGKPQQGTLQLTGQEDAVEATWTDTWHCPKPMTLQGTASEERTEVSGHYSVPIGKDWGWRIELGMEGDQLVMRMYNIWPKGKEQKAVELLAEHAG